MFTSIAGRRIEYEWREPKRPAVAGPVIVLLHEGLGSVAMWKDFPQRIADATGCRALAYSRHGYGQSEPLPAPRPVRYLHQEALDTLPALLDGCGIDSPVLLGHSDGASIALILAGGSRRPLSGVIAMAPHVCVEPVCVQSIAAARQSYLQGNLREQLSRYHADVDSVFWGWNDIWLDPEFRFWNIEEYLPRIGVPLLAIQGMQDQYGTMEQIKIIGRKSPHAQLLELPECGHSPHRDQAAPVIAAVSTFIDSLSAHQSLPSRFDRGPGLPSSKP